jgi:hypothetical protein
MLVGLRWLVRMLSVVFAVGVSLGLLACGSSEGSMSSAHRHASVDSDIHKSPARSSPSPVGTARVAASAAGERKDSADGDDDASSDDDREVLDYGTAADASVSRAISKVVKRYYTAAAAGKGAEACSLLYGLIAESLGEREDPNATPAMIGKACAAAISTLFKQHHQQMTEDAASIIITRVRVLGRRGLVVLRFGAQSELRSIDIHREGDMWKVEEVFDLGMP